ncbi:MAG: ABC transporter permease [Planctomycetota bacterium]|jgi:ABC-type dipeptide/oligopeptide/nickel transport system permease subunit
MSGATSSLSPTALALRRLFRRQTAVSGLIITVLLVIIGLGAPLLAPHSYSSVNGDAILLPPGSEGHLLGTDDLGRDVLSRLMYGASLSLRMGIGATIVALIIGVVLGLVSGYFGGWVDSLIQRLTDTFMAIPTLLFAIAITAIFEAPSELLLFLIMGFVSWPTVSRLVRSQILSLRENDYTVAARSIGMKSSRILFGELLPNCIGPIIVLGTLLVAGMILFEAGLSFLGLGVAPPYPSWGRLLKEGMKYHDGAPWLSVYPGACILMTVIGLNFFGDGLRDAFDPKMKVE